MCITFVYVFSSWWPLSCIHIWAVVNSAVCTGVPASARPCPWSFLHVPREAPCKWSCVCPGCSAAWLPPPRIVCDTRRVAEPRSFVRVSAGVHPPSCRWTDTPGGCSGRGVRAWGARCVAQRQLPAGWRDRPQASASRPQRPEQRPGPGFSLVRDATVTETWPLPRGAPGKETRKRDLRRCSGWGGVASKACPLSCWLAPHFLLDGAKIINQPASSSCKQASSRRPTSCQAWLSAQRTPSRPPSWLPGAIARCPRR